MSNTLHAQHGVALTAVEEYVREGMNAFLD